MTNDMTTKLVKAKCTNCNAPLEVDSAKDAAICPFCNTAYIVERAINNYNINMTSGNMNIANAVVNISNVENVNNLILRAEKYEWEGDLLTALEYYNRVLDIDITQVKADYGVKRIENEIENYIYIKVDASTILTRGILYLVRGKLIFQSRKGKKVIYNIKNIIDISATSKSISFNYSNKLLKVHYDCAYAQNIASMIYYAMYGQYPRMIFLSHNQKILARNVIEKYNSCGMKEAINYCREVTGGGKEDAIAFINKVYTMM